MVRSRKSSKIASVIGGALLLAFPIEAVAEPQAPDETKDDARIEALFRDAKGLLARGRAHEACPMLEEARRLRPGGGTILALALCYEQDARGATALAAFREALVLALRAKRVDRVELSEEHIRSLEARVSRLTVTLVDGGLPGMVVKLNDAPIPRALWGTAVPVDEGTWLVSASAPGRRPKEVTLHVGAFGESPHVDFAALEEIDLRSSALPPPRLAVVNEPVKERAGPAAHGGFQRGLAYVAGGLGLAGIATGSYFGLRAITLRSAGISACQTETCGPEGSPEYQHARDAALVSTVLFAVGAAGIGAGTVLFVTSSSHSKGQPNPTSVAIVPGFSADGFRVAAAGSF